MMKKISVLLMAIIMISSCSNNDGVIDNNNISSQSEEKNKKVFSLDTSFMKTNFENTDLIKEEGLLINKEKIGLWKEYNNKGELIKAVHYLNNTIEFEIDVNELRFDSLDISAHHLKLKTPQGFDKTDLKSDNLLLALKRKDCGKSVFCPNYNLTFKEVNYDLKDSINVITNQLNLKFEKFKLINVEPLKLGNAAYKITFIGRIENVKLGGVILLFQKNNVLYNFSYLGNNDVNGAFLKQKDIVDEIINSIHFY